MLLPSLIWGHLWDEHPVSATGQSCRQSQVTTAITTNHTQSMELLLGRLENTRAVRSWIRAFQSVVVIKIDHFIIIIAYYPFWGLGRKQEFSKHLDHFMNDNQEKGRDPGDWQEDRNGELGYRAQERESLGDRIQDDGALGGRGQATRHRELELAGTVKRHRELEPARTEKGYGELEPEGTAIVHR
ncbi:hypothetical protein EYF80_008449 [Liparis tanakae]|uniref:Uncharacterized protein n=1 Tax=Liparis tanakae TaxID=230148 RepID=A0A4Z2IVY7_9TELE|nr:hypothetical protein EYF80_008449 [Liparis tanakae]